jgi:hypothetical protein
MTDRDTAVHALIVISAQAIILRDSTTDVMLRARIYELQQDANRILGAVIKARPAIEQVTS